MILPSPSMRRISLVLLGALLFQTLLPAVTFALTDGPAQPEFSTFTPVEGSNLVDPFTGGFNYNIPVISIPGPNGMGYALGLSYSSGASMEDESSWVGYGWTLNAGAINRMKRGYPDDVEGATVTKWNHMQTNWTATATKRLGLEVYSTELEPGPPAMVATRVPGEVWAELNAQLTQRYNNHKGYGYSVGLTAGVMGTASVGYNETDGLGSFSYSVNPIALLSRFKAINLDGLKFDKYGSWAKNAMRNAGRNALNSAFTQSASSSGVFGMFNFNDWSMPYSSTEYSGWSIELAGAAEGDLLPVPVGIEGGFKGTYAAQWSPSWTDKSTYGYLYSGSVEDDDALMDYYVEKEGYYQKRDSYLPIPFSNADHYIVSGQSLNGSFRAYHSKPGTFRPNHVSNQTVMAHGNLDVHFGLTGGIGFNGGFGVQTQSVRTWLDDAFSFAPIGDVDEAVFFRFTGDLGGSLEYSNTDEPTRASVANFNELSVGNVAERANDLIPASKINANERSGRSTYIGYNTNAEMMQRPPMHCFDDGGSVKYRRYSKRNTEASPVGPVGSEQALDRTEDAIEKGIGEFAITKGDGVRYVYGLPVYSKNEANLQLGLQGMRGEDIENNYLAYRYVPVKKLAGGNVQKHMNLTVVGEESPAPYATSHLMTEILSPDFVDRTNDGPTSDDLGGYVKFNYQRPAGSLSKSGSTTNWYKWRSPYRGLHYQRNALSDPYDDVGTVAYGFKELYYLSSVETKTHVAIFYTEARKDAYEANHDEKDAASNKNSTTATEGNNKSKLLRKIELYAKDPVGAPGKLLTTVNFDYDYSLCEGVWNAETGNGKLTLKKVWFEYEGVKEARISPYEFEYDYKGTSYYRDLKIPLTSTGEAYADIVGYADDLLAYDVTNSVQSQNPDYSPFNIDRWGNYQKDGEARYDAYNFWVDQKEQEGFDPAAWQLKRIKLPSGGEIHVQYEQNEYRFVQHRPAMLMVPLSDVDKPNSEFRIDLDGALTMPTDATAYEKVVDDIAAKLRELFIEGVGGEDPDHMFFRFVYALEGNDPDLDRCSSEFISGFAKVADIQTTGTGLSKEIWVTLGDPAKEHTLPDKVCERYVRANRAGIISLDDCDASIVGVPYENRNPDFFWVAGKIMAMLAVGWGDYYDDDKNCKVIDHESSYLRIPLPDTHPKKGGGIRVKRVLMVEPGIEGADDVPPNEQNADDAALYGTEYLYETEEGLSSGVATNEPSVGREENSLIQVLDKREAQNGYEKVFAGEDRDQFEGPVGESIMPAASVGYSRVVARNIYSGMSTTGYAINNFYTAYDYPFDLTYARSSQAVKNLGSDKTGIDKPFDERFNLMTGIVNLSRTMLYRSQGYRFTLTEMHGKMKSTSAHGGHYLSSQERIDQEITDWKPSPAISSTTYDYYEPGEMIPVMRPNTYIVEHAHLGKEVEVVLESRETSERTNDGSLEIDAGVGAAGFIPLPYLSSAVGVGFGNTSHTLRAHVTTKIIKYPAIQKRVTVFKDGATDTQEPLAFDPISGQPILSRNADGYDGLDLGTLPPHDGKYYLMSIPSTWIYPVLGQMAGAERMILRSNTPEKATGFIIDKRYLKEGDDELHYLTLKYTQPGADKRLMDVLSSGDLVRLTVGEGGGVTEVGLYHLGRIAGSRIELLPTSISWRDTQVEVNSLNIEVVRSGRLNSLGGSSGGVTTYGVQPIVIDDPLP